LRGYYLSPEELALKAGEKGSIGVAFTYNEPTINFEYIMDSAPLLRKKDLKVVLVTNGFLESDPWDDLLEITDAANIDIKGFTEEFYKTVTGGSLSPVLRNVISAFKKGVHLEIAYLVIPGYNDNGQVEDFIDWTISSLSSEIPVHFNRFHPDHRLTDVKSTPTGTLLDIKKKAITKGMANVFIGNVGGEGLNDTICPECGKVIISRKGFRSPGIRIKDGKCPRCSHGVYGVWK
jgi:pyruvate formate lyase activating enzyme